MKHTLHTLCLLGFLLFTTACGEDRSGEYYALTQEDTWIEEIMSKHYLWYNNMPALKESDYFAEPAAFLKKLVYNQALGGKGDSFSYVETKEGATSRIYLNRTSTYGFDFELMTDPLGTTSHTMARVLFVLPNSPASEAGLHRGDWISAVNKEQLTTNNYGYLINGGATRFARESVIADEDGEYIWEAVDTLDIAASRPVELNPFYIDSIYDISGKKIAYMMYNQFSTGPDDQPTDTEYAQQMLRIFTRFKSQSPDAFILDLRYNTGGYLSCARQLASLLAPASALGKVFCTLEYNDITDPQKESITYNADLAAQNMDLGKIYILTSEFTASASEAVINCLRPYMKEENVVLIGETTYGKPVSMQGFEDARFDFTLWPVTAYVLNSEGKAEYERGIAPTYELDESALISPLYPLGDIREYLLRNTLSLITTGTMPDVEQPEEAVNTARTLYNSIGARGVKGVLVWGEIH
ncbi:S41 family peptidase [Phocaeicola sp.]